MNNIKKELTAKLNGRDYDKEIMDAWNGSDLRLMQLDMEKPFHYQFKYTKREAWALLPDGQCEQKPSDEDIKIVHYLLSYLNLDGIKRRLNELISKS